MCERGEGVRLREPVDARVLELPLGAALRFAYEGGQAREAGSDAGHPGRLLIESVKADDERSELAGGHDTHLVEQECDTAAPVPGDLTECQQKIGEVLAERILAPSVRARTRTPAVPAQLSASPR